MAELRDDVHEPGLVLGTERVGRRRAAGPGIEDHEPQALLLADLAHLGDVLGAEEIESLGTEREVQVFWHHRFATELVTPGLQDVVAASLKTRQAVFERDVQNPGSVDDLEFLGYFPLAAQERSQT